MQDPLYITLGVWTDNGQRAPDHHLHADASLEPKNVIAVKSSLEVIKFFCMLNSTEHELYPAHKC